jgi:hypothetical protein
MAWMLQKRTFERMIKREKRRGGNLLGNLTRFKKLVAFIILVSFMSILAIAGCSDNSVTGPDPLETSSFDKKVSSVSTKDAGVDDQKIRVTGKDKK